MHIRQPTLRKVDPRNILRLAHYLGVETLGRTIEDIIQELHILINFGI